MKKIIGILFCLHSFMLNIGFTAPPPTTSIQTYKSTYNKLDNDQKKFDITEANKIFDQTNLKLSTQNLDIKDLIAAIKLFKNLNTDAEDCIDTTQQRLNNINTLIQSSINTQPAIPTKEIPINKDNEITADQAYLNNELKYLTDRQAECRLFSIRSTEAINAYQAKVAEIKQQETFSLTDPIWEYFPKIIELWNTDKLFKTSFDLTQTQFTWNHWLIHACISLIFATIIVGVFVKKTSLKRIFRVKNDYLTWELSLFLSLWLIINWGACSLQGIQQATDIHICHMLQILSIFSLMVFVNTMIFSIKRVRALFYWYELDLNYFYNLVNIIICLTTVQHLGTWLKFLLSPAKTTLLVAQSIFLLLVILINISLFFRFLNKHRHFPWIKKHRKTLKALNLIFFLSSLICSMIGYHILATHLVYSSLITIAIVFLMVLILQALEKLYQSTLIPPLHDKIRYIFGYKESHLFSEFFILKITMQTVVISIGLYFIGESMGYIGYYVAKFYQPLLEGLNIGNITIYPARILLGITLFCVLLLLFQTISTAITRYYQFNEEEDTQVAIASILNYIGFAFALITGLLIAGFNFTGLAIVAGALSVGIGLGLQSIVNNFVSGLILLIEKPIKPGDRINVDGVEGIVKKIRVRSTQIITPAREDIIVPNSDLVTRRVTNYMYTDKYLSIYCQVVVPYDVDVKLVEDLLLQAANQHDDVIKTSKNKPNVLLKGFGDHGLIFQLWCLIRDANKKSNVQSELNLSILNILNKHHIKIPILQQHIYIHQAPTDDL